MWKRTWGDDCSSVCNLSVKDSAEIESSISCWTSPLTFWTVSGLAWSFLCASCIRVIRKFLHFSTVDRSSGERAEFEGPVWFAWPGPPDWEGAMVVRTGCPPVALLEEFGVELWPTILTGRTPPKINLWNRRDFHMLWTLDKIRVFTKRIFFFHTHNFRFEFYFSLSFRNFGRKNTFGRLGDLGWRYFLNSTGRFFKLRPLCSKWDWVSRHFLGPILKPKNDKRIVTNNCISKQKHNLENESLLSDWNQIIFKNFCSLKIFINQLTDFNFAPVERS